MNNIKPYPGKLSNLEGKLKGEVCVKVLAALKSAELVKAAGGDLKLGNTKLTATSVDGLITFFRYLLAVCMQDTTPVPKGEGGAAKFRAAVNKVSVFAKLLSNSQMTDEKARAMLKELFEKNPKAETFQNLEKAINADANYSATNKVAVKSAAKDFFLAMNEPKVYVFINEGVRNGKETINTMLNQIGANNKAAVTEYVGGAKQQIAAVVNEMNFSYTKNASGGSKPSAIMMIGASGAGKTTVIKKILAVKNNAKSPFTSKADSRIIIAPKIRVDIQDAGTVLTLGEEMEKLPMSLTGAEKTMEAFENAYARPTPFNDKSSRAHHIFKYGEGLLGDLCGTESASDISLLALGVDIFSPEYIGIFNVSTSYTKMEGDNTYALATAAADVMIQGVKGSSQQQKWANVMGKRTRYGNQPIVVQNLKSYKVKVLEAKTTKTTEEREYVKKYGSAGTVSKKGQRDLFEIQTDFALSVIARILVVKITNSDSPTVFNEPAKNYFGKFTVNKLAGEANTNIVVYVAKIIMRCLESMWISRSLDELSMVYDTTRRGSGALIKTSDTYHVPPGMTREKTDGPYKISARDLPKMNTNKNSKAPYALGVRNQATNLLHLAKLVEPNLLKGGSNAIASSKIHRLFILLRFDGLRANNKNTNNPQRKTLERLTSLIPRKATSVLKRTQSANRYKLAENPNKSLALAIKISNGMGQSSREANAARRVR